MLDYEGVGFLTCTWMQKEVCKERGVTGQLGVVSGKREKNKEMVAGYLWHGNFYLRNKKKGGQMEQSFGSLPQREDSGLTQVPLGSQIGDKIPPISCHFQCNACLCK